MKGNVAEDMLRILSSHRTWSHGFLFAGPRACLMGARLRVAGNGYLAGWSPADGGKAAFAMRTDPYTVLLARIITEQFPERMHKAMITAPQKVIAFNDYYATRYTDIRLVLEKAAVAWEETGNG